nr:hypothetical protein [Escherichia coli O25b:H4-ST131]
MKESASIPVRMNWSAYSLGRSETFCFAHCKTNAFNERGLRAAS